MKEAHFIPEMNKYLYTINFNYKGKSWCAPKYVSIKEHKAAKTDIEKEYLFNDLWEARNKRIAEQDKQEALDNGWHYGLGLGV